MLHLAKSARGIHRGVLLLLFLVVNYGLLNSVACDSALVLPGPRVTMEH